MSFTKGAPEVLLRYPRRVWDGERRPAPATRLTHRRAETANDRLAARGMRVLAVAFRALDQRTWTEIRPVEQELILIGLIGMIDPARPEAETPSPTASPPASARR